MQNQENKTTELLSIRRRIYKQASFLVVALMVSIVLVVAITTAWFTNITQTGNLEFQIEQFGFSGEIFIQQDEIQMAPGDSGVLEIEMNNTSNLLATTTVRFDKGEMDEEMQKRIYFYVDETYIENDITYNQRYLNSQYLQVYDITSQDTLTLSKSWSNDTPIQWEWVEDVMGYYVVASIAYSDDEIAEDSIEIIEYLQPVDYQLATATFDGDGNLITVDGTTTKEEYLTAALGLEESDTIIDIAGYYSVDTEYNQETSTITGTWLYLCDLEEIQEATAYDTAYGLLAADMADKDSGGVTVTYGDSGVVTVDALPDCTVTAIITGQQKTISAVEVGSEAVLLASIADSGSSVVQLVNDVTITSAMSLSGDQDVVLDLNGNTLSFTEETSSNILVSSGARLTILDGTLNCSSTEITGGIYITNGRLLLSNVTIESANRGICCNDYESGTGVDSTIQIKNSFIDAAQIGVLILGNGAQSTTTSKLFVENSTIDGAGYIGIAGNGSDDATKSYWGTEMYIYNSTISGYWGAIFQPQQSSSLYVKESYLSGYTGIAVKGGTVMIEDSIVEGTGATAYTPAYNGSGYTDTAAGISVETNYSWTKQVEVINSVVTSVATDAIIQYVADATNASVIVYSGEFSSNVSAFVHSGSEIKTDGNRYYVTVSASEDEIATMSLDEPTVTGPKMNLLEDEIDAVAAEEFLNSSNDTGGSSVVIVMPEMLWDMTASPDSFGSSGDVEADTEIAEPETETTEPETPETETPEAETPETETPETETPETETPETETPEAETPEAETPEAETPEAETPEAETPEAETPEAETPEAETPEAETPEAETPEAETPEAEMPEAETPEAETPEAETPETETPEAETTEPATTEPETTEPEPSTDDA